MARYTPSNLGGDLAPVNPELEKIETAFQDTLSRKGDTPNSMETNLDMNNNRILNLPAPQNTNEAVRLIDTQGQSFLPSQDGNSGKFLKTDGSVATWQQAYNTDNLNPNVFGGDTEAGWLAYGGVGVNVSTVEFYLDLLMLNKPNSAAIEGQFTIVDENSSVSFATNVVPYFFATRSSNRVGVVRVDGLSGVSVGGRYALRAQTSGSKITFEV